MKYWLLVSTHPQLVQDQTLYSSRGWWVGLWVLSGTELSWMVLWLKFIKKKKKKHMFFSGLFWGTEVRFKIDFFSHENWGPVILYIFSFPPTELVSLHSPGHHRHAELWVVAQMVVGRDPLLPRHLHSSQLGIASTQQKSITRAYFNSRQNASNVFPRR